MSCSVHRIFVTLGEKKPEKCLSLNEMQKWNLLFIFTSPVCQRIQKFSTKTNLSLNLDLSKNTEKDLMKVGFLKKEV